MLKSEFKTLEELKKFFAKSQVVKKIKELEKKAQIIDVTSIRNFKELLNQLDAKSSKITQSSRKLGIKGLKEDAFFEER